MSSYGVHGSGFVKKPIEEILASLEVQAKDVLGNDVIQTPESPMGQINGIMAEAIADVWETSAAVYLFADPDQANGNRLKSLSKLRLIGDNDLSDIELRRAINNENINKFNLRDVEQSLIEIDGITYLQTFLNDDGSLSDEGLILGDVCIALIGGSDSEIANKLSKTLPVGGSTYGNTAINSELSSGVVQQFKLLRISEVEVKLSISLRLIDETYDQFLPDTTSIVEGLVEEWQKNRINGRDVNSYTLRRIIESKYTNIQLLSFKATVNNTELNTNASVEIGFDKMALLKSSNITATLTS